MTPYQEHKQRWIGCSRCSLSKTRKSVCLARGTIPSDVLFIGEAPGPSEDVLGKPFVGIAGKLLDQIVEKALSSTKVRPTVCFTNLVACIPKNPDDAFGGKFSEPPKEAIEACSQRLDEIIYLCQPKLFVCVGALAEKWLSRIATKFNLMDSNVISIIHPAALLRMENYAKPLQIQKCVVTLSDAFQELRQ